MCAANLGKGIKGTDFQSKKDRILTLYYLLDSHKSFKEEQIHSLANAILVQRDKQKALSFLKRFTKEHWYSIPWGSGKAHLSKEEEMWRSALTSASKMSDSDFLSILKTKIQSLPVGDEARGIITHCEATACGWLTTHADSLASRITQQILSTQKGELNKQALRELKSEEDKELKVSRAEFIRRIEYLCRDRSRS